MTRRRPTSPAVAALAAAAVAGALPVAAEGEQRPPDRVVHRFDFEERDVNFEDLPMHWYVIGRPADNGNPTFDRLPVHAELTRRPGFPAYTQVRFDDRERVSGRHSFHLGLDGGSAGAFLEAGTLAAVAHSDYTVTAMVKTTPMAHARARLVAYFMDDRGRRIDASVASSEPVQTAGRWEPIAVHLRGAFATAAWIGLEVQLVQPEAERESPLGRHRMVYQDVRGSAWFDDITVWQVPHVEASVQTPLGVIRSPERPRLSLHVRDLTARPLSATVTIYDHELRPVASSRQLTGEGSPPAWQWAPPLERYGWYLCDLIVREAGEGDQPGPAVARSLGAFLWLDGSDLMLAGDAQRFALDAEELPAEELALLPDLLNAVDLGAAVLSCWPASMTLGELESQQAQLDELIQRLALHDRRVTLSLAPLPAELARVLDVDPQTPLPMFARRRDAWMKYVAPVLLRLGQRVHDWRLGSPEHADGLFLRELPEVLAAAEAEFLDLAPQPRLVLPWRLDHVRRTDARTPTAFALHVPRAVAPEQIAAYLQPFAQPSSPAWLQLEEAPADVLAHADRVTGLARRMVYGWESGVEGLALRRPWTRATSQPGTTALAPDPLLGVFTGVAHRLAGRRSVGRLPLGPGLEGVIFDGPAGGMLAAWNRCAPDEEAVIDLFLGPAPVAVDVWGNRTPVAAADGRHRLALTRTPIFIEGIDAKMALFRAGFRVEPAFLESSQALHQRSVTITNPWPRTISGQVLLVQPAEWRIEPRRSFFSIPAGGQTTLLLDMAFPASEVAGPKQLVARFDFTAEQRHVVDLMAPLEVGLRNVDFDATLVLERNAAGGQDAIVTQLVTNTGTDPLSLYAFANLVGFPRQERLISRLLPGQSIVRRFRFEGVPEPIAETAIRVGVREASGPAVLNKIVRAGR